MTVNHTHTHTHKAKNSTVLPKTNARLRELKYVGEEERDMEDTLTQAKLALHVVGR